MIKMKDYNSIFVKLKSNFRRIKRSVKLLIFFLAVIILTLTVLSLKNYLFTETDNYLNEADADQLVEEEIPDINLSTEINKKIDTEQPKSSDLNLTEKIAAVEEIRDPFFPARNRVNQDSISEEELIYSEAELKADLESNSTAAAEQYSRDVELYDEELHIEEKNKGGQNEPAGVKEGNNISAADEQDKNAEEIKSQDDLNTEVIEVKIPFSLLGIIRDRNFSAALFSLNGRVIKKREGESIENFSIEKIGEEMVVLNYHDYKYKQYIWRHDNIEEK